MSLQQIPKCPRCGMEMSVIYDGTQGGTRFVCPQCPTNGKYRSEGEYISAPNTENPLEEPGTRFRRLLQSEQESRNLKLPESLLADLPADARRLLSKSQERLRPSIGPRLSEDLTQALLNQGVGIDKGSGAQRSVQDPFDNITQEERRCPNCDALIPAGHGICTWCGTPAE